jgi:hypothetical protein
MNPDVLEGTYTIDSNTFTTVVRGWIQMFSPPYNCSKGITINGICPSENIWIHSRTTVVKVLLSMVYVPNPDVLEGTYTIDSNTFTTVVRGWIQMFSEGHIPLIVIPLLQLYGGELVYVPPRTSGFIPVQL